MNAVSERIQTISSTFQKGQGIAENAASIQDCIEQLNVIKHPFSPVAYEGTAMGIAETDIHGKNDLKQWRQFRQLSGNYTDHVMIGLGWAIAAQQEAIGKLIGSFNEVEISKILDGYGYYHCLFRKRAHVFQQDVPSGIDKHRISYFDKGLGRGLWYLAKGEIGRALELINAFAEERRPMLLIGTGLACTFVGGLTENEVSEIIATSGTGSKYFCTGIVLAALGRATTGTVDEFSEEYSRLALPDPIKDLNSLAEMASKDPNERIEAILKLVDQQR